MSLYSATTGRGADVVLLHGWGLNSAVWQDTAQKLTREFRVTVLDLPGHGRSSHTGPCHTDSYGLPQLAQELVQHAPPQAVWVGWSLGGMAALHIAAHYPQRVKKLVLVASTPKFSASPGWAHGIEPEELAQFAEELRADYRKAIQRFLALQLRGSDVQGRTNVAGGRTPGATEHASVWLRQLRDLVFRYGEPQLNALHAGLAILRDADLRPMLAGVSQPALLIAGARDTLAPLPAQEYMAAHLKRGELRIIPGAAHAPFLTHSQEFQRALRALLHD
ncbi:MAG: alpha/beta fold hydrolase [Gammaproteobacteria bacterium]|nr:alpha/beta fold hydrolase [Gammaproteobacteria bacterium]